MLKKLSLLFGVAFLFAASCDRDDDNCVRGNTLSYSCCTGTTFIDLNSSVPLGGTVVKDGVTLENVIQVVGEFSGDDICLNLRPFDPEKDANLIGAVCYCLVAHEWDSLPKYVITPAHDPACVTNP